MAVLRHALRSGCLSWVIPSALSMGIQMSLGQEDWGTIVDDAGLLGCGFVTGYDLKFEGHVIPMNPHCNNEAAVWISDIRSFEPQAIVVDMGWWDSFRHIVNGKVSFLAQPHYDSLVEQRILALIDSLRAVSAAPIYFLSVPWMQPPALPKGQPEPAASTASHDEINSLIQSATRVLDYDSFRRYLAVRDSSRTFSSGCRWRHLPG